MQIIKNLTVKSHSVQKFRAENDFLETFGLQYIYLFSCKLNKSNLPKYFFFSFFHFKVVV